MDGETRQAAANAGNATPPRDVRSLADTKRPLSAQQESPGRASCNGSPSTRRSTPASKASAAELFAKRTIPLSSPDNVKRSSSSSSSSASPLRTSDRQALIGTPSTSHQSPRQARISSSSSSSLASSASISPRPHRYESTETQQNGTAPGSVRRLASITQSRTASGSTSSADANVASPLLRSNRSAKRHIGEAYQVGKVGVLPLTEGALDVKDDGRAVVWLDIDNTLYRKSTRIAELMTERIRAYFLSLGLSNEEAERLHSRYYKEYGLAIRGLVMHHQIDALDYDAKCDAALPLERILRPDKNVKALLRDIDRSKCRVWALTNAYKTHAVRVLRLLGLLEYIEGVIFCDYSMARFACKPETEFYQSAMAAVGLDDPARCYFVDDSALNIRAARALGWRSCVLFAEPERAESGEEEDDREEATGRPASQSAPLSFVVDATSGQPAFRNKAYVESYVRALPHALKQQLLDIVLQNCMSNDIAAVQRLLREQQGSAKDYFRLLPDHLAYKIVSDVSIPETLRCRRVSQQWRAWSLHSSLWKSHFEALSRGDAYPPTTPVDDDAYEALAKRLYLRERNWARGLPQTLVKMQGHTGSVAAMKLRGKSTLVTGSYDETIRVWNLSTGACTKVLRAKAIACLDFLIDDGILAAGLYDTGRVMLWDMKTWTLLRTLSGHNKGIRHVSMSNEYLVSVGQDKAIVVWDWRTGAKIARFGQQYNVSLGVSIVDTDKLVAVTVDGIIRTFDLGSSKRDIIGHYDIRKLSPSLAARLGSQSDGSKMLQWFAAHGDTMTVGSHDTVVHLRWKKRETIRRQEVGSLPSSTEENDGELVPDLGTSPIVVSIVHTENTSVGCVDAAKQRIVCARRLQSQRSATGSSVGTERRLYTATFTNDSKDGIADGGENSGSRARRVVPIGGQAWQAHAAELSQSAHNPVSLVCDQDHCVIGTSSGLMYSLGFAEAERVRAGTVSTASPLRRRSLPRAHLESGAAPSRMTPATSAKSTPVSASPRTQKTPPRHRDKIGSPGTAPSLAPLSNGLNVEIADLTALRTVWSHLFSQ